MSAVETKLFKDELLREGEELGIFTSLQRTSTPKQSASYKYVKRISMAEAQLGELSKKMRQRKEVDGPIRETIESVEKLGVRREFRSAVLYVRELVARRLMGVVLVEMGESEAAHKKEGRRGIRALLLGSLRSDRKAMAMKSDYWASGERAYGIAATNHMEFGAAVMAEIERRRANGTYDQFKTASISDAIELYMGSPGVALPEDTKTVLLENIYGEEGGMSSVIKRVKKAATASVKEFGKRGVRMSQTGRDLDFVLEHIISCAKNNKDAARSGAFIYNTTRGALDVMKSNQQNFSPDRLGLRDDEIIDLIDGAAGSLRGASPMLARLGDDDARGALLLIREGVFKHRETEKARRSGRELPYG